MITTDRIGSRDGESAHREGELFGFKNKINRGLVECFGNRSIMYYLSVDSKRTSEKFVVVKKAECL